MLSDLAAKLSHHHPHPTLVVLCFAVSVGAIIFSLSAMRDDWRR